MSFNKYIFEKFTTEIQSNVYDLIQKISEEHSIPIEKLQETYDTFFQTKLSEKPMNAETKTKKKTTTKKTINKKETPIEKRCIAKTKEGQCKGVKSSKGPDNHLCSLHNRSGTTNYGVIEINQIDGTQEEIPKKIKENMNDYSESIENEIDSILNSTTKLNFN
jgi:hypothetical protein